MIKNISNNMYVRVCVCVHVCMCARTCFVYAHVYVRVSVSIYSDIVMNKDSVGS